MATATTLCAFAIALQMLAALSSQCAAQQFETSMCWPLCGRMYLSDPLSTACPMARCGNAAFNDLPLSDPLGPRKRESMGGACDFHRGVDIAAPVGTKAFAVAAGRLEKVENDYDLINGVNKFDGITVVLRHYRPSRSSCGSYGQYFTRYHHLNSSIHAACDSYEACGSINIVKGQLIGTVGTSWSGFAHLHFESREAPRYDNCSGNWAGDAFNPLRILPYVPAVDNTVASIQVNAASLAAGSANPIISVTVNTSRVDFDSVKITMSNSGTVIGTNQAVQSTAYASYNVNPNWYSIEVWNRQWSHKDSASVPWSSFACGGVNACPYCASHAASYNSDLHLDQACAGEPNVCCFNGVRYDVTSFNSASTRYVTTLTFTGLSKVASQSVGCVRAEVKAASGAIIGTAQWGLAC